MQDSLNLVESSHLLSELGSLMLPAPFKELVLFRLRSFLQRALRQPIFERRNYCSHRTFLILGGLLSLFQKW